MKLIQVLLVSLAICATSPVKATEAPFISPEQFNAEWQVNGYPEVLKTADGTPLFQLDVTVTLEWELNEEGELANISVIEEIPAGQGYADIIIAAMRDSELEAKTNDPTLPVRVRGTFEFRSL